MMDEGLAADDRTKIMAMIVGQCNGGLGAMQDNSADILGSGQNAVAYAVNYVGGPVQAARLCGRSRQAVDKWVMNGRLPRTEYTGETCYAEKLAAASEGAFTAEWLLAQSAYRSNQRRR